MVVSDGNERNVLDESFRDRGKSNEEKIASLERDVNGRGGIFAVMQELKTQLETLSRDFNEKLEKFDNRLDDFDKDLREVKRLAQGEKDIRVDKEKCALDNAKPVTAMKYNLFEKMVWAVLAGIVSWIGWLVVTSRSVTK